MGKAKKKFKRRHNVNLRARYLGYRTSNTALKNKIRRNVKRIYGLVLARTQRKLSEGLRQKIKAIIWERVTLAQRKAKLFNAFTGEVLNELSEVN